MIISKTPLRMSFVGGGSDMAQYYRHSPGAVISTAVNRYIYVTANRKFDDGIRVAYSKNEEVTSVGEVEHRLVKAALEMSGVTKGIEITTVADIPSRGTGLGSSSSFTVGLLNALNAFKGSPSNAEQLAADACRIEIDICGEPIGKQDQYAAACGGMNLIEFYGDETVKVSPVIVSQSVMRQLQEQLLVFFTGVTRSASALLQLQGDAVATDADKRSTLGRMVELAYSARDTLQNADVNAFTEVLHENWELKKQLAKGVSNPAIDDMYDAARANGATGGKILGAGSGGFMALFAPREAHDRIRKALHGYREFPMKFENYGSRIIFYEAIESRS